MQKLFYTTILLAGLLSVSCGKVDKNIIDNPGNGNGNGNGNGTAKAISLNLSVTDFAEKGVGASTRATTPASDAEKAVKNIYVFLFPTATGQQLIKYSSGAAAAEGAWTQNENKVTINKSQSEAGNREVYVVANYDADMKTALDNVTDLAGLQSVLKTTAQPWTLGSDIADKGLLMEGHTTHNFTTNYQLQTVPLTRAVAKVEINFSLNAAHQKGNATDYGYKYANWGTQTWVVEKADQQVTGAVASHADWQTIPGVPTTGDNITVTDFKLTAYINEYANSAEPTPTVELKLPFDGGFLPPPEFGDGDKRLYKLPLQIKRNTVYKIEADI